MDPALVNAYLHARYLVYVDGQKRLIEVGQHYPWLDALLSTTDCKTAAFLTACNPKSELVGENLNKINTDQLKQQIQQNNWLFLYGSSDDHQGEWGAEASFLVFGISAEQAQHCAKNYQQNAYLWIQTGRAVELSLTDFSTSN